MTVEGFLKENSRKIVGVGDIFDYSRSSIIGESEEDYLNRTKKYWENFEHFIVGNHSANFLRRNFQKNKVSNVYRKENVLALHGHQFTCDFNPELISKYESKFDHSPKFSLFWEIEERTIAWGNKLFRRDSISASKRALEILKMLDKRDYLKNEVDTVIVGHDHLAFDTKVMYNEKMYRVANCGSGCKGFEFNPVYVEKIDRWFVSDLHLGTSKSSCV